MPFTAGAFRRTAESPTVIDNGCDHSCKFEVAHRCLARSEKTYLRLIAGLRFFLNPVVNQRRIWIFMLSFYALLFFLFTSVVAVPGYFVLK